VIRRAIVYGIFVSSACTVRAAAAEVCVMCSGPEETYRCTIDQAAKIERFRNSERVLQYLCIAELAKVGGHAKCRVSRDANDFCSGVVRTIRLTDLAAALPSSSDAPPHLTVDGPEAAPEPVEPGPPKTVEELARRTTQVSSQQWKKAGDAVTGTAKSAGTQLERAGDAIGGAVRKTWLCLTSLFNDC
jgi:hypothetical protein